MRSPIVWFGGKGNFVRHLLPLLPQHQTYVEVFGGGASLLFAKPPSPVEVYNDLDSGLVHFYLVLRDPEMFERFYRAVYLTPYSREEYYHCREHWREQTDPIERARQWYVVARQSFSGIFSRSWCFSTNASTGNMSKAIFNWTRAIDRLPQVHERLRRVQIEHKDFRELIPAYDSPETLFYLDPPYVLETRRDGGYEHEMTLDDHREMVDLLLRIEGKALLSGYEHEVYEPLVAAGWVLKKYDVACYSVAKTKATGLQGEGALEANQRRTECVWISPSAIVQQNLFE